MSTHPFPPAHFQQFLVRAMMEGQTVRLVPVPPRDGEGVEFYAHIYEFTDEGDKVHYSVDKDEIERLDRAAGG